MRSQGKHKMTPSASARRENDLKRFKAFYLNAKAVTHTSPPRGTE